jgi:hypothetical protein
VCMIKNAVKNIVFTDNGVSGVIRWLSM